MLHNEIYFDIVMEYNEMKNFYWPLWPIWAERGIILRNITSKIEQFKINRTKATKENHKE